MPLTWAAYQVAWPALSDKEKAAYRKEWETAFKPHLEPLRKAAQAAAPPAAEPNTGGTPTQSLAARQAQMQIQQQYFQTMSNVLRMQAETGRIFAANMGNSYTYQYRY